MLSSASCRRRFIGAAYGFGVPFLWRCRVPERERRLRAVLLGPWSGFGEQRRGSAFPFCIAPLEGAQHGHFPMPDILLDPKPTIRSCSPRSSTIYHRTLKETTEGLDYLRSRGITVGEAIDRFRIGYANRTLGSSCRRWNSKAGKEIRTRLQQLGLLPEQRPRTLQRLRGVPDHGGRWQRADRGHLRAEDARRSSQGHALAHAPVGPAAGRVERRGVPGRQRNHPLPVVSSMP